MLHGSWWNRNCSVGLMSHRLDLHPSDVGFMNVHTQGTFISPPCLIYSVYISISLCKPSSLVYRWVPSISCIIISKLGHRGHTPVWCPWRVGSHAEVIIWTWGKGLIVQRVLIHHYRRSSVLRLPGIFFWPLASSDHTTDDQDGQNHEDGSSCDWSNDHSLILFLRLFTGV